MSLVLREPMTDAPVTRIMLERLIENLSHSRCIDNEGAEFVVGMNDLTNAQSYLEQLSKLL